MNTFNIEKYLNSLPEDSKVIDVSSRGLICLPDLSRFKKIKELYCNSNKLTYIPSLPKNLSVLICDNNKLTNLPQLPKKIKKIKCCYNELTCLPELPKNLKQLHCDNNNLKYLPDLPVNLEWLSCSFNNLVSLPALPDELNTLYCDNNNLSCLPALPRQLYQLNCIRNEIGYLPSLSESLSYFSYNLNPIFDVLYYNTNDHSFDRLKQKIEIINKFRDTFYALKFKKQFREWLWVKVREPTAKKLYDPSHLDDLKEEDDLDLYLKKLGWLN